MTEHNNQDEHYAWLGTEERNYFNEWYSHDCATCKQRFLGHKRRIICRQCAEAPLTEQSQDRDKYETLKAKYSDALNQLRYERENPSHIGRINTWQAVAGKYRYECQVLQKQCDAKQAKIDALMLEYCPVEMTPEQVAEWGKHQKRYGEFPCRGSQERDTCKHVWVGSHSGDDTVCALCGAPKVVMHKNPQNLYTPENCVKKNEISIHEPVAWFIDVTTDGKSTGRYEVADRQYWGDRNVCIPLYTAPLDAQAIRRKALEDCLSICQGREKAADCFFEIKALIDKEPT